MAGYHFCKRTSNNGTWTGCLTDIQLPYKTKAVYSTSSTVFQKNQLPEFFHGLLSTVGGHGLEAGIGSKGDNNGYIWLVLGSNAVDNFANGCNDEWMQGDLSNISNGDRLTLDLSVGPTGMHFSILKNGERIFYKLIYLTSSALTDMLLGCKIYREAVVAANKEAQYGDGIASFEGVNIYSTRMFHVDGTLAKAEYMTTANTVNHPGPDPGCPSLISANSNTMVTYPNYIDTVIIAQDYGGGKLR
ncbi:MAG: hypothetical protein FWE76_01115 [Symbiobacteriaceae bacterium]|nr:hypothetical protein [Symbiobacteriaceae bacterium]